MAKMVKKAKGQLPIKALAIIFASFVFAGFLASCGGKSAAFYKEASITVVSREEGSGTRGAFVQLFGIEEKLPDGSMWDNTSLNAVIVNNTSVMMTIVANDPHAIGYISLGSVNAGTHVLAIDGVLPSAQSIRDGQYKIARPFNIATKKDISAVAEDFVEFILSVDGQDVVLQSGYVPLNATAAYAGQKPSGKVVVAGSSSVTPVMEKLKEAYALVNPNAKIEIQQSDSSTGISALINGICDIGMASRQLKESEVAQGALPTVIAMDGIVIIVGKQNPISGLTSRQVGQIYTGSTVFWQDVGV